MGSRSSSASANSRATNGWQVVQRFADTDEVDRHRLLAGNRKQDATFGGAIEFRHDQSRQADRIVEGRVPGPAHSGRLVPSDHQQHFVGAPAGSALPITRLTFFSSSIRCCWVGRRPAVSASSTSTLRALAALMASNMYGRRITALLGDHRDIVALAPRPLAARALQLETYRRRPAGRFALRPGNAWRACRSRWFCRRH